MQCDARRATQRTASCAEQVRIDILAPGRDRTETKLPHGCDLVGQTCDQIVTGRWHNGASSRTFPKTLDTVPIVNLNDLLTHYRRVSSTDANQDVESLIRLFGERHMQRMSGGILKVGQQAPDVAVTTLDGSRNLSDLVRTGPVVLKFYRGRWCPYCTLELRAYERAAARIVAAGGRVIALSPQSSEETERTRARDHLTIDLVTDDGNRIANRFGLAYQLDAEEQQLMRHLEVDLPSINAHDGHPADWSLALPALYLIGPDRRIEFAFVDPDYRKRGEPDDVVALVERLKRVRPH